MIISALAIAGFTGVSTAAVLKYFLEKSIESSLEHHYDKLLETQKTQNAVLVEQLKTENVILAKRWDLATQTCAALEELVEQIESDLPSLQAANGQTYLETLLVQVHPKYRRRFQTLRAKFEATNDVLSSYSIAFDKLSHPDNIRSLATLLEKQSPSNTRRLYRKVWVTVAECLRSLTRVTSDPRFWDPRNNYLQRADAWAAHDADSTRAFLVHCVSPETKDQHLLFHLSLENDGGVERFWRELPGDA